MGDLANVASSAVNKSVGGAALNTVGNAVNSAISYYFQKKLLRNQYEEYLKQSKAAGATPAAIAQGISGSGASSTPSVGSVGSTPDIAANTISAEDVEGANSRRSIENRVDLMRLTYEPQKYFADIRKTFSEIDLNKGLQMHYKGLTDLNREIERNYRVMRPWQIATLSAGLRNSLAEFNKINAETETQKSLKSYYDAQGYKSWNEGYNESLKSFGIIFDNNLRAAGINPNLSPWDAVKQAAFSDPKAFQTIMDNIIDSANKLDARIATNLGEHYKRNIALAAGAYGFGKLIGKSKDKTLQRLQGVTGIIGNMMPFAHPMPSNFNYGMGVISPYSYFSNF